MFEQFTTSEDLLEHATIEIWEIASLYNYSQNLSGWDKEKENPFLVFLHLSGYYDKTAYVPYDFEVSSNLGHLELNLLAKALISWCSYTSVATAFLDKLLDLLDNEALGLDQEESESL
jgi:hypothetical protein